MPRSLTQGLLVVVCFAAGCTGEGAPSEPRWTEHQAASIKTVRSLPVRVVRCRGLGDEESDGFRRLDCLAGTRAPWETYDTIAVTYVLRPLEEYASPQSRHELENVRFVGGPGIP